MGAGELMLHRLGADPAADVLVWSRPQDHEWMAEPWVAADGALAGADQQPGHRLAQHVEARRLIADVRAATGSTTTRWWWSPS